MWRSLPFILLASCAVDEPREPASQSRQAGYRIVNIVDVPLNPSPRSDAETNVEFGTRQPQCNNATAIHAGGGELAGMRDIFGASTCVRVVTRCEGAC